jgi:glycosyltransferase involved in cell wall biosynthesis
LLGKLDPDVRARVNVSTRPYGSDVYSMIDMYQSHHAFLCPSRAEGFGIQPLESRACGVPTIQTFVTGMADHDAGGGTVHVETGPLTEAWGDFGLAPEVKVEHVVDAIRRMVDDYDTIKQGAVDYAQQMAKWSWLETTRELAYKLKGRIE